MSEQTIQGDIAQEIAGNPGHRSWRLPVRSLGLLTGASLLLCYDLHVLWLVYDLVLIGSALWLIWAGREKAIGFMLLVATIGLSYIIAADTDRLYAVLSVWDTYKHLILLIVGAEILRRTPMQRLLKVRADFERVVLLFFAINVVIATYQAFAGYHFDNVAGLIGPGGTHSFGILSLLAILVSMRVGSAGLALIVVVVSLYANWIAENIGVYVLGVWVFGYACILRYRQASSGTKRQKDSRLPVRFAALGICGVAVVSVLLVLTPYGSRLTGMVAGVANAVTADGSPGGNIRARMLVYGYELGGNFGAGPGVFSKIYADEGSRVDELENPQLNISEAAHQLAEYGLVGLLVCLALYSGAVYLWVGDPTARWFCLGLLFMMYFYNRFLIDERIAFLSVAIVLWVLMETMIRHARVAGTDRSSIRYGNCVPMRDLAGK